MEQMAQVASTKSQRSNPVMEPGPLSETGTWRDFVSVTKVGITVANLMTVFAGLWLSSTAQANGTLILWTLLGTALVIMSGTCLNNYIDRDLDRYMERTAKRALAKGRLNPTTVMWMGIGMALVGSAILTFLVNPLTAVIGLIGLFDYVVVYTMWLKRTSTLSTIGGAISGAVPIVMGWTAYSNNLDMGALTLFLIMFMWQMPHTLALSIRRSQDYGKAGIPVLPVVKGFEVTKRHMLRYVAAMIPTSILVFEFTHADLGYLVTMMVIGLIWLVHTFVGFFAQDTIRWARQSFVISLIYLTSMSIVFIVETSLL
ncbi:protoheme IX farnesyltransferase [Tumebacillus sp. ITR2]|uniref:Protoheme IX farnesyltransferase n=1 Tax=Tumebacillus amylolyticus TaxID=2801339 RepID=A0ABS1J942_9BACL|nr:heme o synthase [Tumebacillus amylolyticus]MBL0386786.1 protoheme IX farnesyltransferase [Tumebacillus amylolyticus]